MEQFVGLETAI